MSAWERLVGAVVAGVLVASLMAHALAIANAGNQAAAEVDRVRVAVAQEVVTIGYPEEQAAGYLAHYPEDEVRFLAGR